MNNLQPIVTSPITNKTANLVEVFDNELLKTYYESAFDIDITTYLAEKNNIALYECPDTGYQFYHPFDVFGDEFFYDAFSKRYDWYYQPNRWEYRICQKAINFSNLNVLEVGCGDGHFLEKIKPVAATIKGLELNTKAIEIAKQKGLDVEATSIQAFSEQHPKTYDVVAIFQVLEHIADVSTFLEAALACLKPGGKLLIAVPNNDSILLETKPKLTFANELHQRCTLMNMPPHHMGRWNSRSLTALSKYLPIHLNQLHYEPIWYYRTHYLEMLHFSEKYWLSKFFKKENVWFKIYFKLAQPRIKGHTILGIYTKS